MLISKYLQRLGTFHAKTLTSIFMAVGGSQDMILCPGVNRHPGSPLMCPQEKKKRKLICRTLFTTYIQTPWLLNNRVTIHAWYHKTIDSKTGIVIYHYCKEEILVAATGLFLLTYYSLIKYLPSTYIVTDILLGAENAKINKRCCPPVRSSS